MQQIKRLLLAVLVALGISVGYTSMAFAGNASSAARDSVCNGISTQVGQNCDPSGKELDSVIATILRILSYVAGIAAVIMIIISGLKYITSGGDASSIASAKTSLIYAIVGIIIVVLAQAIVQFVLKESTGG